MHQSSANANARAWRLDAVPEVIDGTDAYLT